MRRFQIGKIFRGDDNSRSHSVPRRVSALEFYWQFEMVKGRTENTVRSEPKLVANRLYHTGNRKLSPRCSLNCRVASRSNESIDTLLLNPSVVT